MTRNYGGVLYATPGLTVQPGVNNNALMPGMSLFSAHGGISTEGRVFVDGVSVNGPFGQNSVTQFAFDVANAQEMQVLVGGGLGESETSGPIANIIPKSGGNTFSGSAFFSGTPVGAAGGQHHRHAASQGMLNGAHHPEELGRQRRDRRTDRPRSALVLHRMSEPSALRKSSPPALRRISIRATRQSGSTHRQPGVETRFTESKLDFSARLTSQVTPRNRVTFSYQPQYRCLGSTLTTSADGCRVRGRRLDRRPSRFGDHRPGGGVRVPECAGQPDAGHVDVSSVQPSPRRCRGVAFLVRHHRQRECAARCAAGHDRCDGKLRDVRASQHFLPSAPTGGANTTPSRGTGARRGRM